MALNVKKHLDFKYIIREVLLIFIGINLAIWFNNWNANKKVSQQKGIVVSKIKDEIINNSQKLELARDQNQNIAKAYKAYKNVYKGSSTVIVTTPEKRDALNKLYPNFFIVQDSIKVENNNYKYNGQTFIELEIPDITSIAWKTIQTVNIANEFNYNCLYELENIYNLQERLQNEIDEAADMLQKGKIDELLSALSIIKQLDEQLNKDYNDMLEIIDNCR